MFIADFHIHSKYSRATSRECVPEMLELWARRKGLQLIGTGDFTHAVWREELREKLTPAEEGLYKLKSEFRREGGVAGDDMSPRFIVTGEISSIYKKNGKVRKVHNLLLLPGLEQAEALSRRLEAMGGNLHSDGRPILGLDSHDLLEMTLDVCPDAVFIPAHIWTPHFSLFGAYSGFDDIYECFEDLTEHIHALETGLSSDPPMNWRLSALDRFTLVSNSDAHSPANLAREANIFNTPLSFPHISKALEHGDGFCGTIEFFPEEGKYHYDGHRNCGISLKPSDTIAAQGVCPVCGGRLTVGVLHRVEALADRVEGFVPPNAKRFESLVPLNEVIAASMGMSAASKKVKSGYESLIGSIGPELYILREAPLEDIERSAGSLIAEGVRRLRCGDVRVEPGYDGEYGKVSIMSKDEISLFSGQLSLFKQEAAEELATFGRPKEQRPVMENAARATEIEISHSQTVQTPDALNEEQQQAACAAERAVAVVAGPGTGKTKTLVSRIAHLVEERGVKPTQITAVTFTNKAASEMRSRLEAHFGSGRAVKRMAIGTFHSICLKLLSDAGQNVTVIDEAGALSVVGDILADLGFKDSARDVLRDISLIKNGALKQEDADIPPGVFDAYNEQLKRYGVLDYDDILINALALFEEGGRRAEAFTHILVDEFQDINAVQYRLIKAWSRQNESVFIIGDPDQSIYGFRGSDLKFFDTFFEDFPCRRIRLKKNYRSTPEILRCACSVMAEGQAPMLEAGRERGASVRLLEAGSAFDEALFVAKEINRMVGGIDMLDAHGNAGRTAERVRGFSDIAVLYRTNRQSEAIEQCLAQEGIPYTVSGRGDFLSEPEAVNTIAFFSFLLNPRDLLSLRTYLKSQAVTRQAIEHYACSEKGVFYAADILESLKAGRPAELLRTYGPLVCKEKPVRLVERWISDNALSGTPCMDMLYSASVMYDDMPSFIHNLALGRESDVVRSGKKYAADAVSLMTLHGAKGLEFPVVFLCGVNDGLIPYTKTSSHGAEGKDPAEERRLFYVGMTRAKDELILLTSSSPSPYLISLPEAALSRGKAMERKPSPAAHQLSFF